MSAAAGLDIVDSQVHVWGANTPARPWTPDFAGKSHGPPEMPADAVIDTMDRAGVAGALIVPPSFEGDRNDLGLAAVAEHPNRFRVLGRFRLADPDAPRVISKALRDPRFVGVRLTFNAKAAGWLSGSTLEWFWDYTEASHIAVSMFPRPEQFDDLERLAERHPALKVTLDHLACSENPATFDSMDQVERIARFSEHPSIAVKASALPISFPKTYSPETVERIMTRLVAWYGADRVFWGSDFTRAEGVGYTGALTEFLAGLEHFSAADIALVMGAALRRWYGWPAGHSLESFAPHEESS